MGKFNILMAIVVLTASIILLFNILLTPQPISIILETGEKVESTNSELYPISHVLFLITLSFLIGSASVYLFYNSGAETIADIVKEKGDNEKKYGIVIPLLKGDERRVFSEIVNSKGEALQNELGLRLYLSKVKMTRVLAGLERKNLVVKERYGLTNRIRLK